MCRPGLSELCLTSGLLPVGTAPPRSRFRPLLPPAPPLLSHGLHRRARGPPTSPNRPLALTLLCVVSLSRRLRTLCACSCSVRTGLSRPFAPPRPSCGRPPRPPRTSGGYPPSSPPGPPQSPPAPGRAPLSPCPNFRLPPRFHSPRDAIAPLRLFLTWIPRPPQTEAAAASLPGPAPASPRPWPLAGAIALHRCALADRPEAAALLLEKGAASVDRRDRVRRRRMQLPPLRFSLRTSLCVCFFPCSKVCEACRPPTKTPPRSSGGRRFTLRRRRAPKGRWRRCSPPERAPAAAASPGAPRCSTPRRRAPRAARGGCWRPGRTLTLETRRVRLCRVVLSLYALQEADLIRPQD